MAISTIRLQSLQSDSNLHKKTAISTIWQQFLQSDCNLHNRTAIYTIRLQCRRIAVWLLRLQSDCWDCSLIAEIAKVPQLTYTCPNPPQGVRLQSPQWNCNLYNQTAMHEDCSLNAEIAKVPQLTYTCPGPEQGLRHIVLFWLLRLQSDCWDCSLIAEIAVWLLILQSDCWDCSLIAEIAKVPQLTYTCPNPPQGVRQFARCFILCCCKIIPLYL